MKDPIKLANDVNTGKFKSVKKSILPFFTQSLDEDGNPYYIGDPEKRIQEDYLRILRFVRFSLNYDHKPENTTMRSIRLNIKGISKVSKERILIEANKILSLSNFFLKGLISFFLPHLSGQTIQLLNFDKILVLLLFIGNFVTVSIQTQFNLLIKYLVISKLSYSEKRTAIFF